MPHKQPQKYCAIYTRKSSEEGLEQEYNSLDAQREACEAYIQSQRHEGWKVIPVHYDDGGFSGGTMERPGLQQLLADIDAGKVHVVVVYKVDRLTRALADFAKIVETFDAMGVSFVSVTQQFNTTSSMGRLTLNVLLSFAQFEREVTGERIRDKIAASKKKGMWMGGNTPMGYDVKDRKLVINYDEAETVRAIFENYLALRSVRALKTKLDHEGVVSKIRTSKAGNVSGGKPLSRGALYKMLSNRIYIGEIVHKDLAYPGEHQAIIEQDVWERTQKFLSDNAVDRRHGKNATDPSLLTGIIYDGDGNPLTPSHANKEGVRYRYYMSERGDARSCLRLPAREIESLVIDRLAAFLTSSREISNVLPFDDMNVSQRQVLIERAKQLAERMSANDASETKTLTAQTIHSVTVHADRIVIEFFVSGLLRTLDCDALTNRYATIKLECPYVLKRKGNQARLIIDNESAPKVAEKDEALIRAVAKAHLWNRMLIEGSARSMREIGRNEGVTERYIRKVLPLAHLAPDIVSSICEGHQPRDLTLDTLVYSSIPNGWSDQRQKYGFRTV